MPRKWTAVPSKPRLLPETSLCRSSFGATGSSLSLASLPVATTEPCTHIGPIQVDPDRARWIPMDPDGSWPAATVFEVDHSGSGASTEFWPFANICELRSVGRAGMVCIVLHLHISALSSSYFGSIGSRARAGQIGSSLGMRFALPLWCPCFSSVFAKISEVIFCNVLVLCCSYSLIS